MYASPPVKFAADEHLDARLDELPDIPAVFLLRPPEGDPYLARTSALRRRLKRLLGRRGQGSRLLNLRMQISEVWWWAVPSQIEAALTLYELAREYRSRDYIRFLKLRTPYFVKMITSNEFPRTQVTARWTAKGIYYGPFQTRAAAEHFEHECLDLFQLRRCQEDLIPSPDHPGCVYGEMNMCLRPCQQVVSSDEYSSEVQRVTEFLLTGGKRLRESASRSRDRLSEEMDFEAAAREHKRVERIETVLKLREELVCDASRIGGVTTAASGTPGIVRLWFMRDGVWLPPRDFDAAARTESQSLDRRLREVVASLPQPEVDPERRLEHVALLARWFYSSWREGDWISFEDPAKISYRKLVNSVGRAARPH